MTDTRAEHVEWCKQRALALLDAGDIEQALTSMMSDLGKHDETKGLAEAMAPMYMWVLMTRSESEARKFIRGFRE